MVELRDDQIRGRKVEMDWQKHRREKRERRFLNVDWGWLVQALEQVGTDRATRLLLVLSLQTQLDRRKAPKGWVEPRAELIAAVGLKDRNYSRTVAYLESKGLIDVERT